MLLFVDQDGDKKLTLSEFISLPVGTVENQQAQDIDDDWVRERKKEFEDVIDSNHDAIVTMEELEVSLIYSICFFQFSIFKSFSKLVNKDSNCAVNHFKDANMYFLSKIYFEFDHH